MRTLRFYCKICGEEMWQGWDYLKDLYDRQQTIQQIEDALICTTCRLKQIREIDVTK